VAVVAVANNAELVEELANPTLREICDWMTSNGLQIAPEKSEYVVLTGKHAYRTPNLYNQGFQIPVKRLIRYLGVQLDNRSSFMEHINIVTTVAKRAATALGRLMTNVGSPSQAKRSLLLSVIHSRLLYGGVIWSEKGTNIQKSKNLL